MSAPSEPTMKPALHVLTLTPFYPTQNDDACGCFVAESLPWLEWQGVKNTVIAAQPFYRERALPSLSAPPAHWSRFFSFPSGLGLPASGVFLFASILAKVRRIHRSIPIDVIHAHAALPCGHAAALLNRELGIPFVVTVHGLDAYFTNQVSGYAGQWCKRVASWVYRSARRVICISEKVRTQVLESASGRVETSVIYNGVDPTVFCPANGQDSSVVLSVGNLIPIKGHELLLRAFAAIHKQYPEASCQLIGDGPERESLLTLSQELGIADKVQFLGRQSRRQVADAMKRCAIFALPSRYEGLGCVYLEAMACEKPVIACREQGIEEIIQNGRNGWLIAPGDLRDMTDALHFLLQDAYTRRQMGEAARRTILQGFTLARQAEMLTQLYRGCLA